MGRLQYALPASERHPYAVFLHGGEVRAALNRARSRVLQHAQLVYLEAMRDGLACKRDLARRMGLSGRARAEREYTLERFQQRVAGALHLPFATLAARRVLKQHA